MEEQIKSIIAKHYKSAVIHGVQISGDIAALQIETRTPLVYIAKRIFSAFPSISLIDFGGGWNNWVYSRELLKAQGVL